MLLSLCRCSDDDRQSERGVVVPRLGRRGTTLMEYLMMLSLIVVFCLIAISFLGTTNNANMSSSSSAINKAMAKKGS